MTQAMDELNRYQISLIDSLEQENDKYNRLNQTIDFEAVAAKAGHYCNKLLNLKRDMQTLSERSAKLKKRALRLQAIKANQLETIEIQKYNQLERDKRLQPVIANKSSENKNQ